MQTLPKHNCVSAVTVQPPRCLSPTTTEAPGVTAKEMRQDRGPYEEVQGSHPRSIQAFRYINYFALCHQRKLQSLGNYWFGYPSCLRLLLLSALACECGQFTEKAEGGVATLLGLTRWVWATLLCTPIMPCSFLYHGTNPLHSNASLSLTSYI